MPAEFQPEPFHLTDDSVVYLDNHLLVVDKPPGALVQTDKNGEPSIEDAARAWLKDKFRKPGNVFATAAHRLDRPVGGLVVVARTSKALVRLNAMFQSREIRKIYLAVVQGNPEPYRWLRHWIKKTEGVNKVWTYTYPRGDAKQADLAYWKLEDLGDTALVLVRLFSGRHHQIRAQLSLAGLPIVGDVKYGVRRNRDEMVCLYSYAVEFTHPVTKETIRLHGRLPRTGSWSAFSEPDEASLEKGFTLGYQD